MLKIFPETSRPKNKNMKILLKLFRFFENFPVRQVESVLDTYPSPQDRINHAIESGLIDPDAAERMSEDYLIDWLDKNEKDYDVY